MKTPLFFALVLFAVSGAFAEAPASLDPIADDGVYGCRRPFGVGVFLPESRRTVVCWPGRGMSVRVRAYDHEQGSWGPIRTAVENNWTGRWDYHNYPTLTRAPDGHLLLIYAQHTHSLHVWRSREPGSIHAGWDRQKVPDTRGAYPMPVVSGKRVLLFYTEHIRHHPPYRSYRLIESTDGGVTWSAPRTVIDTQQKIPEGYNQVYAIDRAVDPGNTHQSARIWITWQMHGGARHNAGGRNNYLAAWQPESGTWISVNGTDLGEKIDAAEMDASCLVHAAKRPDGHPHGYDTTVAVDQEGRPFVSFPLDGGMRIGRFRKGSWEIRPAPFAGLTDLAVDPGGRPLALASTPHQIVLYRSHDQGDTWQPLHSIPIPHANGSDRASATFVEDFHPRLPALITTIGFSERMRDYTGRWPVAVLRMRP